MYTQEEESKKLQRILTQVKNGQDWYRRNQGDQDLRNLAYWRGKFWNNEGGIYWKTAGRNLYQAEQNEIFPILDTMASALALEVPQCEALDVRQSSERIPSPQEDTAYAGRRFAAILNHYAEEDELDDHCWDAVMHACIFEDGAIRKISWDTKVGRPVWRLKMPWEVIYDRNVRKFRDARWICERFVLHIDDFRKRVEQGLYKLKKPIKPDTYPRAMENGDDAVLEQEEDWRRKSLKVYVTLYEYWDLQRNQFCHVHIGTKQILFSAPTPYGNPYDQLVWNNPLGRPGGIPDVSLLAPNQRDINELVSARRELVSRLPRRMILERGIFKDEDAFSRFRRAKSWEATVVEDDPQGRRLSERVFVTPEMSTTYDFNRHLDQQTQHIRRVAGEMDAARGVAVNIRTAAEARMLEAKDAGRVGKRMKRLVRYIKKGFIKTGSILRWAVTNPESSKIDMVALAASSQVDVSPMVLAAEIMTTDPKLKILPFTPLMEDITVRRQQLLELMDRISRLPPEFIANIVPEEFVKEVFDVFHQRPSIMKDSATMEEEQLAAQEAAMAPAPPNVAPDMGLPQPSIPVALPPLVR
jgi:hypothetical protein|tara:strand:- start:5862 stop:7610 length:1749 start_codon:yes stop_codon:yes gene_type:complete